MNNFVKKVISVAVCAVLAAVFIIGMVFGAPRITAVTEASGEIEYTYNDRLPDGKNNFVDYTASIGKDIAAVRISDLEDINKITKVNYVADEFVTPGGLSPYIRTVDLTEPFEFAEKGTLIFIILNLDPWADDFYEQRDALAKYKMGDYWQFTLSLPKIFCASNVYKKAELVSRNGEIEGYDFIDFTTSYDKKTEKLSARTARTDIDLNFYTRRETMEKALAAAQIITVHYQSAGSSYSGITECPLIGTESAVDTVTGKSNSFLVAFALIAAIVFAVFFVLSLLKRTKEFVPAIVWVFGIALLLLSRFMTAQSAVPLMWAAFASSASFLIIGGALLSIGRNFGKAPTKYILPALAAAGMLLAFIGPFIPFGAASVTETVCTVIKAVCTAGLIGFSVLAAFSKNSEPGTLKIINAEIIGVVAAASLFMPQIYPAHYNPIFWLCALSVIITFVSVFILFNDTEKANAYLTANLHLEAERQLKDIKAVISERDKLLQFVSHDMKKPLLSSETLIDTLIEREKDAQQTKTLLIVKQNNSRVISNLSEIGGYAKFNYIAEESQVADLRALCAGLYDFHRPDCNANGIVLKNSVDKHYKVFVKKQGLENVVSNLIINAIEHANCSTITLSAKTEKNKTVLCIADNGKGITSDIDVFKPYVSENNSESGGIGLYICKNIIESMNGSLSYESKQGGTVFCISLLKA